MQFNRIDNNGFGISFKAGQNENWDMLEGFVNEQIDRKGVLQNKGILFPLRAEKRDGNISADYQVINKAILDIKVVNARKGKYYRVEWIGNGTTAFGSPNYDIIINEYDSVTYGTNSAISKREIIRLNEGGSQTPSGIFTQTLKAPREDIQVTITMDYAEFGAAKSLSMNGQSDPCYSYIIDPSCYVYTGGVTKIEKNTGVDSPLQFNSDTVDMQGALNVLRKGLLDFKVYNAVPNKTFSLRYITKNQSTYGDLVLIDEVDIKTGERRSLFPVKNINYDISNRNGISTIFLTASTGEVVRITFDYSVIPDGYVPPNTGTTHPYYTNSLLLDNISYTKLEEINNSSSSSLIITHSTDGIVSIYSKYGKNDDIRYVFNKLSVNKLFALYNMYTKQNASSTPHIFTDGVVICKEWTDWISPYIISAVENGDAGSEMFTGGAHGSDNNNTTGFPTAETMNYQIFVDGKITKEGSNYYGERVDIYVKNRIMSYNTKITKRFTHEEMVHYTITPDSIDVEFEMIPYEKLRWKTYYGLQAVTNYYTHVIYPLGQYNIEQSMQAVATDAGSKGMYRVNSILLSKSGTTETLELWMDNTTGLGKRSFVDSNLPLAFTREYNKAYMRLVGQTPIDIAPGEVYSWKGGYRFRK